jgi:hypothetical protein
MVRLEMRDGGLEVLDFEAHFPSRNVSIITFV